MGTHKTYDARLEFARRLLQEAKHRPVQGIEWVQNYATDLPPRLSRIEELESELIRFTAEHSLLLRRIRPPMVIGMAADQLSLLTQSHATLYERLLQLVEVLKQAVGHRFVGQRP